VATATAILRIGATPRLFGAALARLVFDHYLEQIHALGAQNCRSPTRLRAVSKAVTALARRATPQELRGIKGGRTYGAPSPYSYGALSAERKALLGGCRRGAAAG